ncbi:MAG: nucleotidyltransferase domain-containing protein [Clostridia bacterium]|nr:nucleotidyltransferase domain-containing protein [Clostridia bacterium]
MNRAHQKILDAIIRKAERVCPDSLALIGLYGSCATGDTYARSDLDLLILIQDEKGMALADGFILEDTGIGYDMYCTTWAALEADAECGHAHLSKLMDSPLVYVKDPAAVERLEALREKARTILASDARFAKAEEHLGEAKKWFAECFLADTLSGVRTFAGAVISELLDALMLFNGRYFHKGVKRTFEELAALALPFDAEALIMAVIRAGSAEEIRYALTVLVKTVQTCLTRPAEKEEPCRDNLAGTYEEMVSNWRGKVQTAGENGDLFSSFMNMVSCQGMLDAIAGSVRIQKADLMAGFDPCDTGKNAAAFDAMLCQYCEEYRRAGICPKQYADADAFAAAYLGETE